MFADYLQYSTHHEFIIRDLQLLEQTNLAALQADVRDVAGPKADIVAAQNFSFNCFHERRDLLRVLKRRD